jgi:hypothetical protein
MRLPHRSSWHSAGAPQGAARAVLQEVSARSRRFASLTTQAFRLHEAVAAHKPEGMQPSALHGAKPMRTLERCACASLRDKLGALLPSEVEADVVAFSEFCKIVS